MMMKRPRERGQAGDEDQGTCEWLSFLLGVEGIRARATERERERKGRENRGERDMTCWCLVFRNRPELVPTPPSFRQADFT